MADLDLATVFVLYLLMGALVETFTWFDPQDNTCSHWLLGLFIIAFWPIWLLIVAVGANR